MFDSIVNDDVRYPRFLSTESISIMRKVCVCVCVCVCVQVWLNSNFSCIIYSTHSNSFVCLMSLTNCELMKEKK